jgi:ABC-type polysaccharide/polyol phosphate export permease
MRQSFRRPDHWLYGSWLDTVVKYRKTRLGVLWLLIPTAVYIWGIGGFLAAMQPGMDKARFFAHVGLGFAVFRLMTTVLNDSASIFSTYQSFIYDGNLRLTDFILRSLARSFYYFAISLPLVLIVTLSSPDFDVSGVPLSIAGIFALLLNLFFFSVLVAIAGARFPDLSEMMGSITMAAFLVTPIVWYPGAAPQGSMTGALMRANPFYHLLAAVRAPLLGESVEAATWFYIPTMTVTGILASALLYRSAARRIPVWL